MTESRGIRELARDFWVSHMSGDATATDVLTAFAKSIVEQCAQIAEELFTVEDSPEQYAALHIAAAIRSRWQRERKDKMQTSKELKIFNDVIANKKLTWWEIHNSQPGHDRDELFLQFEDGSVVSIAAERRDVGCALILKPAVLPDKPVTNLTA